MNGACFRMIILVYRKSSIKPPGGAYLFQTHLGGLDRDRGLFERECLFSLAKTVVLVLRP